MKWVSTLFLTAITVLGVSAPALAQPTVSIAATDVTATEAGPTTGTFTVTRTGLTTSPLTVFYTVGGTAIPGGDCSALKDYLALPGSVTIPMGSATATILVTPCNDIDVEAIGLSPSLK
jgi:hypothetical protein